VQAGLARIANAYAALIAPPRYAALLAASARALGLAPLAVVPAVLEHCRAGGGTAPSQQLIAQAAALLASRPG